MSSLSLYAKTALSNHVLRNSAFAVPGVLYLALFQSNPTVGDGSGLASGTECSYSGYARQLCEFSVISGSTSSNTNTETFPAVVGSTITVTHWALYAHVSATTPMILFGALTTSKTLDATDVPSFPAGALAITWN